MPKPRVPYLSALQQMQMRQNPSMSSYSPSAEETLAALMARTWYGDNREGTRKAEKLMDVLQFGPVGVATGLDDAATEAGKGNYMAAGLNLAMAGIPGPPVKGIRAYHGSPHDFDKFSMDKIGTGEGAQAYGHGLYFAENEGVAKGYRDRIAGANWIDSRGVPVRTNDIVEAVENEARKSGMGIVEAQEMAFKWSDYVDSPNIAPEPIKRVLVQRGIKLDPKGKMYEVQINADPDQFLDWDKPLSEQPNVYEKLNSAGNFNVKEATLAGTDKRLISLAGQLGINDLVPIKVQSGLRRGLSLEDALSEAKGATPNPEWSAQVDKLAASILPSGVEIKSRLPANWTGESLVNSNLHGLNKQQASELLKKQGIPGIKYLDQGSRGYVPSATDKVLSELVAKTGSKENAITSLKDQIQALDQAKSLKAILQKRTLRESLSLLENDKWVDPVSRNYVVFDDKLIDIRRKYGMAGLLGMLGYGAMSNNDAQAAPARIPTVIDAKGRPYYPSK